MSAEGLLVLKRRSLLGGTFALAATQVACSAESSPDNTAPSGPATESEAPMTATTAPSTESSTGSKVLLAYFSRPGENYYHGDRIDLKVGNTEVVAGLIADRIGCDVHRIEAADPYSDDYDDTVARNVREQDADARPEIANPLPSIDNYDVVLLASPLWNVRPPMIMQTFADTYDFAGKTVYPITTYAVSGLGNAVRDYTAACDGADFGEALAVLGEDVTDKPQRVSAEVDAWLGSVGLLPGDPP